MPISAESRSVSASQGLIAQGLLNLLYHVRTCQISTTYSVHIIHATRHCLKHARKPVAQPSIAGHQGAACASSASSCFEATHTIAAYLMSHLQMTDLQRKDLSPAWKATKPFLNGGLSGMAATCIIQPIDMVKVRIQIGAKGGPVSISPLYQTLASTTAQHSSSYWCKGLSCQSVCLSVSHFAVQATHPDNLCFTWSRSVWCSCK